MKKKMNFEIVDNQKNIKVTVLENGEEKAKAICYFQNTPKQNGEKIGTIGEMDILDKQYGVILLEKCEEILKQKGLHYVVAPMNENTWGKYRTMKQSNGESLFLLENVNPMSDNEILLKANYQEIYTYTSTKGKLENAYQSQSIEIMREKIQEEGIAIRKLNKENYMEDLKKIYHVSLKSFGRNPLYTPIDEESFLKQYIPYVHLADEDIILLAEKDGKEIGFIFCIPDFEEAKRGEKINTIIVKTVAVIPEFQKFAIGNVLLSDIANIAKQKGFENWICAFMYANNASQKMAKRNQTEVIREYALYGKKI